MIAGTLFAWYAVVKTSTNGYQRGIKMANANGSTGGMMTGSTKSSARNAPMDKSGGNMGKPIGDTGKKCPKGNSKTRGAADRYV